jgi:predicted nucleotidyltransferase
MIEEDISMLTIEEIKTYITPIVKKYPIEKVILYGSYARGDASDMSDIDLVVESRGRLRNRKIFALGGELLDVLPVKVDVYDILEIVNPSAMYENIQKEGVIIYDGSR